LPFHQPEFCRTQEKCWSGSIGRVIQLDTGEALWRKTDAILLLIWLYKRFKAYGKGGKTYLGQTAKLRLNSQILQFIGQDMPFLAAINCRE